MKKAAILVILAVLASVATVKFAPMYRHLMAKRLLRAAETADAAHHYDDAFRFYRLAIERDPDQLPILRSCARFLDELQRPDVLALRLRIAQLDPVNATARLDAIETALKFRKLNIAQRLLANPTAEMQNSTRYFDLLGWIQLLAFDLPKADATWATALDKNPGNKIYEANLAMVRLSSTNEAIRNKAFADLSKLALEEKPPLSALDSLMVFATKSPVEPPNLDPLLQRFHALVPGTNPFFISYLDALRRWRHNRFQEALDAYTKAAATQPESAMTAQAWMETSGLYAELLAFRDQLPAPLRDNLQSTLWQAEALFNLKQTDALSALLEKPVWAGAPPLKMAWQERLRRAANPTADYTISSQWSTILSAAGSNDAMLGLLAKLSFNWGWWNEYTLTLWTMSEKLPSASPDALNTLFHFYLRTGNTGKLRQVVKKQLSFDPANPNLQNNFAFLSFLLGADTGEAVKISDRLCATHPGVPLFISTRAFGYLKAGDPQRGLALFKDVDVKQLQGAAPGVCYGYLLAATGGHLALDYLKDAERWASFPEEIAMIKAARSKAASAQP